MGSRLSEVAITVFDTETTGLDPRSGDRVVEIAAVRLEGERVTDSFESFVATPRPISPGAFAVNQITPQMLAGAPSPADVYPRFLAFIKGTYLCSYNAPFDIGFLEQELRLLNEPLPEERVLDVLKLARRLVPGLPRYALWYTAKHLAITQPQQHRAAADVEMTVQVFLKLTALLRRQGVDDIDALRGLCGVSPQHLHDLIAQRVAAIQEAIAAGETLSIRYLSSSNAAVTERQVIPSQLRQDGGVYYMVGYCSLRKEECLFRVDSILALASE